MLGKPSEVQAVREFVTERAWLTTIHKERPWSKSAVREATSATQRLFGPGALHPGVVYDGRDFFSEAKEALRLFTGKHVHGIAIPLNHERLIRACGPGARTYGELLESSPFMARLRKADEEEVDPEDTNDMAVARYLSRRLWPQITASFMEDTQLLGPYGAHASQMLLLSLRRSVHVLLRLAIEGDEPLTKRLAPTVRMMASGVFPWSISPGYTTTWNIVDWRPSLH